MDLLKTILLDILKSPKINDIKIHWINQIANWYPASFVDGVLYELYNLKALNNKYRVSSNYNRRSTIKYWKEQFSDTWKQRYPHIVNSMNETAYPNNVIRKTVNHEVMVLSN